MTSNSSLSGIKRRADLKNVRATGSIKINLTQLDQLGQEWHSETLAEIAQSLSKDVANANAGNLTGNRMFYDNDYMVFIHVFLNKLNAYSTKVHRGHNYVTTVKMFSSRTKNSECANSQNVSNRDFH
jgi:hypothetical protein